jgi:hypothetical protein
MSRRQRFGDEGNLVESGKVTLMTGALSGPKASMLKAATIGG